MKKDNSHADVESTIRVLKEKSKELNDLNLLFILAFKYANLFQEKYPGFNRYHFIQRCGVECEHSSDREMMGYCLVCNNQKRVVG